MEDCNLQGMLRSSEGVTPWIKPFPGAGGISQPGKFAEVWNTTVVKQEGANVTRVRRRKKGGQWV